MHRSLLDLVAVAYRAPQETARFLVSLGHVGVPFTLTVVDNGTPDGDTSARDAITQNWTFVESLSDCVGARLLKPHENLGYARACNLGATFGDAPVLALLNMDVEFTDVRSTKMVLGTFEEDDKVGAVGPRTVDSSGRITHGGIVSTGTGWKHRFWQQLDRGQATDVLDVPTVSGATCFVRRSAWDEATNCAWFQTAAPGAAGGFLPTRHFFEETYFLRHLTAHGYRVLYLGTAQMVHQWHRSSKPGSMTKVWAESKRMYEQALRLHLIEVEER